MSLRNDSNEARVPGGNALEVPGGNRGWQSGG